MNTSPVDSAEAFVHRFHADLTAWFAGTGDRDQTWRSLHAATPDSMCLVYPSGTTLTGGAFLDSIADRYGSSPEFLASIGDVSVVRQAPDHAVVSYVESQAGARTSTASNARSALAVVERAGTGWRWVHIQETALP